MSHALEFHYYLYPFLFPHLSSPQFQMNNTQISLLLSLHSFFPSPGAESAANRVPVAVEAASLIQTFLSFSYLSQGRIGSRGSLTCWWDHGYNYFVNHLALLQATLWITGHNLFWVIPRRFTCFNFSSSSSSFGMPRQYSGISKCIYILLCIIRWVDLVSFALQIVCLHVWFLISLTS